MYFCGVPERTAKLLTELKTWCHTNRVKQVELAKMLGVTPQGVTEWFKGRNQPTGEQVLAMLEILKKKSRGTSTRSTGSNR
jgi:DNA-binding transcriptional regulator YiaG